MENMEETKEKNGASLGEIKDTEIFSFGYLVGVILDYYCSSSEPEDSSEAWKKGTNLEEKNNNSSIPEEVDDLIKKAFKKQLKKFI